MPPPPLTFEQRALLRRSWPVRKTNLQEDDLAQGPSDPTSAWHAVMELTAECYKLAGFDLTSIPRAQWPTRLFRPGQPRPDTDGID